MSTLTRFTILKQMCGKYLDINLVSFQKLCKKKEWKKRWNTRWMREDNEETFKCNNPMNIKRIIYCNKSCLSLRSILACGGNLWKMNCGNSDVTMILCRTLSQAQRPNGTEMSPVNTYSYNECTQFNLYLSLLCWLWNNFASCLQESWDTNSHGRHKTALCQGKKP